MKRQKSTLNVAIIGNDGLTPAGVGVSISLSWLFFPLVRTKVSHFTWSESWLRKYLSHVEGTKIIMNQKKNRMFHHLNGTKLYSQWSWWLWEAGAECFLSNGNYLQMTGNTLHLKRFRAEMALLLWLLGRNFALVMICGHLTASPSPYTMGSAVESVAFCCCYYYDEYRLRFSLCFGRFATHGKIERHLMAMIRSSDPSIVQQQNGSYLE